MVPRVLSRWMCLVGLVLPRLLRTTRDRSRLAAFVRITLELGAPFPPLAQLLSVLPPQSAQLVPAPYRELMLSPTSPVFDAYPKDFSIDLNGKRAEWEAIALLPFIDESRLLGATNAIDTSGVLSEAEQARNVLGEDLPYLNTAGAAWVGAEK